jgi:hypothetical protein
MQGSPLGLSRATLIGALAFAAILVAGAVDHALSHDRYVAALNAPPPCVTPSLPPSGTPAPPVAEQACRQAGLESYEEAVQVRDGSQDRVRISLVALGALIAFVCVAALRRRPEDRARVFNNLAIAGVCVLMATALAVGVTNAEGPELPGVAPWLLSGAMVGAGLVGRLSTIRQMPAAAKAMLPPPWPVSSALLVSAADCAAAFIFAASQPPCGGVEPVAQMPSIATPLILAGLALGLVCLATRHWVSALVAVVANPLAFIVFAGASCAFY